MRKISKYWDEILALLVRPMTADEIAKALGVPRGTAINTVLGAMTGMGEIQCVGPAPWKYEKVVK